MASFRPTQIAFLIDLCSFPKDNNEDGGGGANQSTAVALLESESDDSPVPVVPPRNEALLDRLQWLKELVLSRLFNSGIQNNVFSPEDVSWTYQFFDSSSEVSQFRSNCRKFMPLEIHNYEAFESVLEEEVRRFVKKRSDNRLKTLSTALKNVITDVSWSDPTDPDINYNNLLYVLHHLPGNEEEVNEFTCQVPRCKRVSGKSLRDELLPPSFLRVYRDVHKIKLTFVDIQNTLSGGDGAVPVLIRTMLAELNCGVEMTAGRAVMPQGVMGCWYKTVLKGMLRLASWRDYKHNSALAVVPVPVKTLVPVLGSGSNSKVMTRLVTASSKALVPVNKNKLALAVPVPGPYTEESRSNLMRNHELACMKEDDVGKKVEAWSRKCAMESGNYYGGVEDEEDDYGDDNDDDRSFGWSQRHEREAASSRQRQTQGRSRSRGQAQANKYEYEYEDSRRVRPADYRHGDYNASARMSLARHQHLPTNSVSNSGRIGSGNKEEARQPKPKPAPNTSFLSMQNPKRHILIPKTKPRAPKAKPPSGFPLNQTGKANVMPVPNPHTYNTRSSPSRVRRNLFSNGESEEVNKASIAHYLASAGHRLNKSSLLIKAKLPVQQQQPPPAEAARVLKSKRKLVMDAGDDDADEEDNYREVGNCSPSPRKAYPGFFAGGERYTNSAARTPPHKMRILEEKTVVPESPEIYHRPLRRPNNNALTKVDSLSFYSYGSAESKAWATAGHQIQTNRLKSSVDESRLLFSELSSQSLSMTMDEFEVAPSSSPEVSSSSRKKRQGELESHARYFNVKPSTSTSPLILYSTPPSKTKVITSPNENTRMMHFMPNMARDRARDAVRRLTNDGQGPSGSTTVTMAKDFIASFSSTDSGGDNNIIDIDSLIKKELLFTPGSSCDTVSGSGETKPTPIMMNDVEEVIAESVEAGTVDVVAASLDLNGDGEPVIEASVELELELELDGGQIPVIEASVEEEGGGGPISIIEASLQLGGQVPVIEARSDLNGEAAEQGQVPVVEASSELELEAEQGQVPAIEAIQIQMIPTMENSPPVPGSPLYVDDVEVPQPERSPKRPGTSGRKGRAGAANHQKPKDRVTSDYQMRARGKLFSPQQPNENANTNQVAEFSPVKTSIMKTQMTPSRSQGHQSQIIISNSTPGKTFEIDFTQFRSGGGTPIVHAGWAAAKVTPNSGKKSSGLKKTPNSRKKSTPGNSDKSTPAASAAGKKVTPKSGEKSTPSNSAKTPVNSDKKITPCSSQKKCTPANSAKKMTPVNSAKKVTPAKADEKMTPVNSAKKGTPAKADKKMTAAKSDKKGTPAKADEKMTPVNSAKTGTPAKADKKSTPAKSDKKGTPKSVKKCTPAAKKCTPLTSRKRASSGPGGPKKRGRPPNRKNEGQVEQDAPAMELDLSDEDENRVKSLFDISDESF